MGFIDWSKDIYIDDVRAVIKRQKNHYDQSISLLHLVQRSVVHRRFDSFIERMNDHDNTKATVESLCGFIDDIDIYYSQPAI